MGRPGAGSRSKMSGSSSMHRIGSSAGRVSMHKVGSTVSRPKVSAPSSRPKVSTPVSRPKFNTTSRPKVDTVASRTKVPTISSPAVSTPRPSKRDNRNSYSGVNTARRYMSTSFYDGGDDDERRELLEREQERERERIRELERERRRREEEEERRARDRLEIERNRRMYAEALAVSAVMSRTAQTVREEYKPEPVIYERINKTVGSSSVYEEPKPINTDVNGLSTREEESSKSNSGNDSNGRKQRKISPELIIFIIIWVMSVIFIIVNAKSIKEASSLNRTKLNLGYSYDSNCVDDELGWLNAGKVGRGLKEFWNMTGTQPYIWLAAYTGEDLTEEEQEELGLKYFNETVCRQDAVMLVYFEEADPDAIGNMALFTGAQSDIVMDDEAIDVFWKYLDLAWESYSEEETDDMFIYVFNSTGRAIMQNVNLAPFKVLCIILASIVMLMGLYVFIREAHRRKKEEAEELERVLNTDLEDLADKETEDLINKYK